MAVWESNQLQKQIGEHWVFDGNRLGWLVLPRVSFSSGTDEQYRNMKQLPNKQFTIDMDRERGTTAKPGRLNVHKVQIRQSTTINLAAVQAYINGKISMDNSVLQGIGIPVISPIFATTLITPRLPRSSDASYALQDTDCNQAVVLRQVNGGEEVNR